MHSVRMHWPEYAIEVWALGTFMLSACIFGTLLEHPASPVRSAIADGTVRRVLMGIAMGLTAMTIIYSPWGRRSGAHLNPAFTLTFFRLGRVAPRDALLYPLAQFTGGIAGVLVGALLLGSAVADPAVHHVTTLPGEAGIAAAFGAEVLISMLLMTMVLVTASHRQLARYTGVFAGILVASFISLEAPISGMSMNPARTFGSAFVARDWAALWVYFTAPFIGMLAASQLYLAVQGRRRVPCAKMRHVAGEPCIFCEYAGQSPALR